MISHATRRFWKCFSKLPLDIQSLAKKSYIKWQQNPSHPGLYFKCVHKTKSVYSVRIGLHYRALGYRKETDLMIWFWIGSHEEYNQLIK